MDYGKKVGGCDAYRFLGCLVSKIQGIDDTIRPRVSSISGILRLPGREIQFVDDTACRIVSSLWIISYHHSTRSWFFDDTIHRRVSSVWAVFSAPSPGFPDFDDTMCRIVSSISGVLRLYESETRFFDDTTCCIVSSLLGVTRPPREESSYLMILYAAGYHQFWDFRVVWMWNLRFWWYYVSHSIIDLGRFEAARVQNPVFDDTIHRIVSSTEPLSSRWLSVILR